MSIKPGTRLWSATCATSIVVVRPPAGEIALSCGGQPMVEHEQPAQGGTPSSVDDGGMLLGKRYGDEDSGIEIMCTRGGEGTVTVDGRPLQLVGARALPASD